MKCGRSGVECIRMPAQFLSAVATSRMTSVVSAGGLLGRNRGCYSIPLTRRSVRLLSELCVGVQPGCRAVRPHRG